MVSSAAIAPHLPYLRRFGRALAGSQAGGDAYALQTLQALVEDPGLIQKDLDLRVALYRIFLKVWANMPVNSELTPPNEREVDSSYPAGLETMTPRPRIAFLLMTVEGFTEKEIASALDCSQEDAREFVETARQEIADQMATDVLIIEDEPIIAMDLETLVEGQGHRVIGVATTHTEAIEIVNRQKPGLILADIQLADGSSGLNAVNEILRMYAVPIIFITAYPEYLLTGERPEPTFLLTKPFRTDALMALMSQALFFGGRPS